MKSGKAKKSAPPPAGSSPWLVYYDGKNYRKQIFCCNVSSPQVKSYRKNISALLGRKVLACCHGYLVLYDYIWKRLSLCNSTTFDTTPLPSLEYKLNQSKIDSCILVSSSDSDSLKVLLFFEDIQSIFWCEIGDDEWGKLSYLNLVTRFSKYSFLRQVVSCGRKIFFRICHRTDYSCWYECGLFSMEIVEEPFGLGSISYECMPFSWEIQDGFFNYGHLFGSCDKLFWVDFKWGGMRTIESLVVNVWRYDEGCWKSLKVVKDRAFFLGERYCLSCQESGGGRIYFTKDESLYCYNMEDYSVSVSLPCPDLPAWQLCSPIWIMPEAIASNTIEDGQQCIQENDGTVGLVQTGCPKQDLDENGLLDKLDKYVVEDIVSQLPPLDYMNFRSASRGCRAVAPLAGWERGLSRSTKNLNYTFPLLMFPVDQADGSGLMYKLMDPRIKNNYYMVRVAEVGEDGKIRIHYSDHAWLLTSTGFDIHLHNPFKGSIISPMEDLMDDRWIEENEDLFFKTTSSGLLITSVIFIYGGTGVAVTTISPSNELRNTEVKSNRKFNATNIRVHFQDAVLYLDHNGNIGKLKLGEEGDFISWLVLDRPKEPCKYFHPNFLVECGGELLSVCVENGGKDGVAVYKLNEEDWGWERVMSLGDYTLYLSRSSSFSVPTTSPELRNIIYFPSLHESSGIVFFSLETGKWHSSGSQEPLNCFYGSRFQLNSCWIKPNWS